MLCGLASPGDVDRSLLVPMSATNRGGANAP